MGKCYHDEIETSQEDGCRCDGFKDREPYDLICPECGSAKTIYYGRYNPAGLKPWYCEECGFEADTIRAFIKWPLWKKRQGIL
jgi:predicted RNA-binding Zn-ribbon protein involved in translation (DUF1610 family)